MKQIIAILLALSSTSSMAVNYHRDIQPLNDDVKALKQTVKSLEARLKQLEDDLYHLKGGDGFPTPKPVDDGKIYY